MRTMKILFVLAFVSCMGAPSDEDAAGGALTENKLKVRIRPDGTPAYDVLFTNPSCGLRDAAGNVTGPYNLTNEVTTYGGTKRSTARQNAYCIAQYDSNPSGIRPTSPLARLTEWITGARSGDEIFAAYFSFSNKKIKDALITAANNGAKIVFAMDLNQDHSVAQLVKDGTTHPENVTILDRGNVNDVGYHHNKYLMINPSAPGPNDFHEPNGGETYIKLVFSSGNMSSGTVLHQENWHFMEVARSSYFAQSHVCDMNALRDTTEPLAYAKRKNFTDFMDTCRGAITAAPETDIWAYFIPSRTDSSALRDRMSAAIAHAGSVDVAAHRFSLFYLQSGIRNRLTNDTDFTARLVADDDLYWLNPMPPASDEQLGDNMPFEMTNVIKLTQAGGGINTALPDRFEARFIETNSDGHLLHHNKFMIARNRDDNQPDTVVAGAANFTNDAYWYGSDSAKNNFENIYIIQVPHIVAAMERQFDGFWRDADSDPSLGTSPPPRATRINDLATCTPQSGQTECSAYTHAVDPGAH